MRKLFALILAICLIACVIAIPAYAVTPTIKVPNIKVSITKVPEVKISDSFWDKWFAEHPIVINLGR